MTDQFAVLWQHGTRNGRLTLLWALVDRADVVHVHLQLFELLVRRERIDIFGAAECVHKLVAVLSEHLPVPLRFILVHDLDLD